MSLQSSPLVLVKLLIVSTCEAFNVSLLDGPGLSKQSKNDT